MKRSPGRKRKDYSPASKGLLVGAAATVLALINMSAGGGVIMMMSQK